MKAWDNLSPLKFDWVLRPQQRQAGTPKVQRQDWSMHQDRSKGASQAPALPARLLKAPKVLDKPYPETADVDGDGSIYVLDNGKDVVMVQASSLAHNFLELQEAHAIPHIPELSSAAPIFRAMPNPDRLLADGDPIYSSFIDCWGDDVSGNRTKSYNKHNNMYITHRNLPCQLLQQEFHIHFISTSQHASIPEQFKALKEVCEETHRNPIKVRDGLTGETARFRIFENTGPGDNPMQSEICSHIRGSRKSNFSCQKCQIGGTNEFKHSEVGYATLFEPGLPRSKELNLQEIDKQLIKACSGVATHVEELQTATGVKCSYTQHWVDILIERARTARRENPACAVTDIQQELHEWVLQNRSDIINPFLLVDGESLICTYEENELILSRAGFDPTKDTPVKLLYTILLGTTKYVWYMTHSQWKDTQKQTFAVRLQSTETQGLSIPPIRAKYIMQYANSLIGWQLKTVSQVASGELTALLWFPAIYDMNTYIADLKVAIANVLDLFSEIDPSKIVEKVKLHLLTHIPEDVVRLGPIIGSITEGFESYNGVFRYSSISSIHLAASRDIALDLAAQEGLRHRLIGGYWPSSDSGDWVRSGPSVRDALRHNPVLRSHLGWTDHKSFEIGMYSTETTQDTWIPCVRLVAESQDICKVGSWVVATSSITNAPTIGRISEILRNESSNFSCAVLDCFKLGRSRHPAFSMPTLSRRMSEITYLIVPTKCKASGRRFIRQERVETALTEEFIEHGSDDHFIVNMHSLHNAHLVCQVIPRNLSAPTPFYEDRDQHHSKASARLQRTARTKKEQQKLAREQQKQARAQDNQAGPSEPKDTNVVAASDGEGVHMRKRKRGPGNTIITGGRLIVRDAGHLHVRMSQIDDLATKLVDMRTREKRELKF
ncbi:hypothetical protein CERSUDRAFT_74441 [Gelatoporia subvermispora B]|uniref:Uncharacterized protein n=1 Tax=Ceriporiopsis subvermispora (strain B) TaxID=914234 RepID=M2QHI4_CERS8|nr:hypothetical protein CERSUDRAFT_74441 [Gelatoporia subvermispora B]